MPRKRPRKRLKQLAKWGGVAVCAVIVAAWALNRWWVFGVVSRSAMTGRPDVLAVGGCFVVRWGEAPYRSCRFFVGQSLRATTFRCRFDFYVMEGQWGLIVPLWSLLLPAALPTAYLWRRDRLARVPGLCVHCGYNLSGNTSGVCPECGQMAKDRAHSVR